MNWLMHFTRARGVALLFAGMLALAAMHAAHAQSGRRPEAQPRVIEALGMIEQVVTQVGDCVRRKDLASVHVEDVLLGEAMAAIFEVATTLPGPVQDGFRKNVEELGKNLGELHYYSDLKKQGDAERHLLLVLQSLGRIKEHFPATTVQAANALAERYVCPSHPEITGARREFCGKCGRALEQRWRLVAGRKSDPFCSLQTVRANIRTEAPLVAGRETRATLSLRRIDGRELFLTDLMMSHGSRVHLMVIDQGLSDYHHVHPTPTSDTGDFEFSFVPAKPGAYLAWADIRPAPMGLHEFAAATIAAETKAPAITDREANTTVSVGELTFHLQLGEAPIRAARTVRGKLRISTLAGSAFTELEPVMEAFAHFTGFHEDRRTVVHFHPTGLPVTDAAARGGPELEFLFFTPQPGLVRLFAEVQIAGARKFALFNVNVVQ